MINIIIPMAGKGSRFMEGEYKSRKPFLPFTDSFMIDKVMQNLMPKEEHLFILIMQQKDYLMEIEKVKILQEKYNVVIKCLDFYTEGPVCTSLFARELFNNDDKFLLANCDQFVKFDVNDFISECEQFDGSILTFDDPLAEPKWSFVELNEDETVSRVVAKEVISENVVVGLYLWKKGKDYVQNAIELIIHNDRANGEFFQCPVYNYGIKDGLKFSIMKIDYDDMYALGVPDDYENSVNRIVTT